MMQGEQRLAHNGRKCTMQVRLSQPGYLIRIQVYNKVCQQLLLSCQRAVGKEAMARRIFLVLVFALVFFACNLPTSIENGIPTTMDTPFPFQLTPSPVSEPQAGPDTAAPAPEDPSTAAGLNQNVKTRYIAQAGTPLGIQAFTQQDLSCKWSGVGGQAFNLNGDPVVGLRIEVAGSLAGQIINQTALTGSAPDFGLGGYEIKLADIPTSSQGSLYLIVYDPGGAPISAPIYFDTYADCDRGLVLLNLVEVPAILFGYFPFIPNTEQKYYYFPLVALRGITGAR